MSNPGTGVPRREPPSKLSGIGGGTYPRCMLSSWIRTFVTLGFGVSSAMAWAGCSSDVAETPCSYSCGGADCDPANPPSECLELDQTDAKDRKVVVCKGALDTSTGEYSGKFSVVEDCGEQGLFCNRSFDSKRPERGPLCVPRETYCGSGTFGTTPDVCK